MNAPMDVFTGKYELMKGWVFDKRTILFLEYLESDKQNLVKKLTALRDPSDIIRLQGELCHIERILDLFAMLQNPDHWSTKQGKTDGRK